MAIVKYPESMQKLAVMPTNVQNAPRFYVNPKEVLWVRLSNGFSSFLIY